MTSDQLLIRGASIAVGEGATIAAVVVGVVHSGLGPFIQALMIAITSSAIGAVGLVVAAHIASRQNVQRTQEVLDGQAEITAHIQEVKDTLANGDGS